VLLSASAKAQATNEPRRALLIGNAGYQPEVGALKNPHNDIKVLGKALSGLGFRVTEVKDADRKTLVRTVRVFADELKTAGDGAIGFFYYSGHGAAEVQQNTNYLIPVDVRDTQSASFWDESVDMNQVLRILQAEAPRAVHFIVFDACRNELRLPSRYRDLEKGFVEVRQSAGTFLAFATAPGTRAADAGELSGPYATALATEIIKPGQTHLEVFSRVASMVYTNTGQKQTPWFSAGIVGGSTGVCFTDCSEAAKSWQLIREMRAEVAFEDFVRRYPDSRFTGEARERLDELKKSRLEQKSVWDPARRTKCDELAGNPSAVDTRVAGVPFAALDHASAIPVCEGDVKNYPTSLRLRYQLARAYAKAGRYDEQFKIADELVTQGYGPAMGMLGSAFEQGHGKPKDLVKAREWLQKGVDAGDPTSMITLGYVIAKSTDQGAKEDAVKLYRRAAELGGSQALQNLGSAYQYGRGVEKDHVEAIKWYEAAYAAGLINSAYAVGRLLLYGETSVKNETAALAWLKKAADAGHKDAMFLIGWMHAEGKGELKENSLEALSWYRKAAKAGSAPAMNNIAVFYANGEAGLAQDLSEAINWYRQSAIAGGTKAMINISRLLFDAPEGSAQVKEAIEWLAKAAANGSAEASIDLARRYLQGEGVGKDLTKALSWYRAAAKSDEEALIAAGLLIHGPTGLGKVDPEQVQWFDKTATSKGPGIYAVLARKFSEGDDVAKDDVLAFKWFEKAAEMGDSGAMLQVGLRLFSGIGVNMNIASAENWLLKHAGGDGTVLKGIAELFAEGNTGIEKNMTEAAKWFQRAADAGDAEAMMELGVLTRMGLGVQKDPLKSKEWFDKAVTATGRETMTEIGKLFLNGSQLLEKSETEAASWFSKAAKAGDFEAMWRLGLMYFDGNGVERSALRATLLFTEAAAIGGPDFMLRLAQRLQDGEGVQANKVEAVKWLQKAAESGNPTAMVAYGFALFSGAGIQRNAAEAKTWFDLAAERRPELVSLIGRRFAQGDGVARDEAQALKWLEIAANSGDPAAMTFVGLILAKRGDKQSDARAAEWLRQAAEKNVAEAMTAYGKLLEEGRGVSLDFRQAAKMYRQAIEAHDSDAEELLEDLYRKGKATSAKGATDSSAESGVELNQPVIPSDKTWLQSRVKEERVFAMRILAALSERGAEGFPKDPQNASKLMFTAIKRRDTKALEQITGTPDEWSEEFRKDMQVRLTDAGLYKGPINGAFDAATIESIRRLAAENQGRR
jgi:TPR repeat protein